jgi:succinyl-CoA synthetase beta subunit
MFSNFELMENKSLAHKGIEEKIGVFMDIHEYQAKQVLSRYGVPIPVFTVASNVQEAEQAVKEIGLKEAVVKIQVHAGGRGKAGGVKFGKSKEEILAAAEKLLGMKMVNNQTGPRGVIAHQVLISQPVDIQKEFYLGAAIDRESARPILIASPEGGMEIEEIAVKHPDKILKLPIELSGDVKPFRMVRLLNFMGWKGEQAKKGAMLRC